jgi:hypothetical protein
MKTLNLNRVLIVISIGVILLFLILNIYTPLVADDYSYSIGINSVLDILKSQYYSYFNWGGRNPAHFIAQFWLLSGKPFFNIANTLIYCVFIFLIQFHITGNIKKLSPWLFLTINIFFWFSVPAWGQNFLWLIGSCNYLWTTVLVLLFLVPFRKKHNDSKFSLNLLQSILLFITGILAGWGNENSGAAILFLLIAYFIVKIIRKDQFALFEILGSIGFLLGFSLLIAAPGNYVRAEVIRESGWGYMNDPFLVKYIKRFIDITRMFIRNHGFLLMFISIILGFDHVYHQKRKLPVYSYFYALAALTSGYSMLLSPTFPDRAFLIVLVFSVITLGNVLVSMKLKLPIIIKRNMAVLIIMVLIPLANSFFDASIAVVGTYLKWYDRLEYILAEKEKGNLEIKVRPIITTNKHVALYGLLDLLEDNNDWPNTTIASYFGINSIKINDKDPLGESSWLDKRKRIRQLYKSPWGIVKRIREIE